MIKSIEVRNFRGIKECKIGDFALVNVFVGENGSGKSIVLDAVYLVCKDILRQNELQQILKRRAQREVGGSELWYGYNSDEEIVFDLVFNASRWRLTIYREGEYIRRRCLTPLSGTEVIFGTDYLFDNLNFLGVLLPTFLEKKGKKENILKT